MNASDSFAMRGNGRISFALYFVLLRLCMEIRVISIVVFDGLYYTLVAFEFHAVELPSRDASQKIGNGSKCDLLWR